MSQERLLVLVQTEPQWLDLVERLEKQVPVIGREDEARMGMDDVSLIKQVLGSVWSKGLGPGRGPKDWAPVGRVGERGMEILLDRLNELPAYINLKEQATVRMIAEAARPDHRDVNRAFAAAQKDTVYDGVIDRELWEPVWQHPGSVIVGNLFMGIHYESTGFTIAPHLADQDLLRWNPWDTAAAKGVLQTARTKIEKLELEERLQNEFRAILKNMMDRFWVLLGHHMTRVDLGARLRFLDHWDSVLMENREQVKWARREMLELLERER